jgi:signal transduction histidine kinase
MDHVAPRSLDAFREKARSRYTGPYQFYGRHKDGREVALETRSRPMTYRGRMVWVTAGRDVTERLAAEEKLRAYQARLRALASELALAEERERRRIAADLHDHLMQSLGLARIKLGELGQSHAPRRRGALLDEILALTEQSIDETRSLMFDLSPPVLYELGFPAAVEWLAEKIEKQQGFTCRVEDDGQPKPLDDEVRVVLFQAVRELLTNVAKHASAREVRISLARIGDQLRIELEDDGVGFDASTKELRPSGEGGFGLFNISERLDLLSGELEIESTKRRGTRVTIAAPLVSTAGRVA